MNSASTELLFASVLLKLAEAVKPYQVGFRVVTLGTQHKFFDEPIKHILQLVRLVGSIDDVTIIFGIKLGLSTKFTTKKLGWVCGEQQN